MSLQLQSSGAPTRARNTQETSDSYAHVLLQIGNRHRVIVCRDAIQWILQRRKNGGAERPWRALGFYRTRKALIAACATLHGQVDPCAMGILLALLALVASGSDYYLEEV